jgi:hypothetical protein
MSLAKYGSFKLRYRLSTVFLTLLVYSSSYVIAQKSILGVAFSYGPDFSYADLADRYGTHTSFGVGTEYLTASNFGFSLEWRYMFGDNVRTEPYSALKQIGGSIVGVDGTPADYFYTIVGDQINIQVRKILGKKGSGFVVGGSLGLFAYKTVLKDLNRTIAQSFEPYSFYYDQLSRGVSFKQIFGYEFHSDNGLINGSITLENSLGFAKAVRGALALEKGDQTLMDNSFGIRARWVIPFKKGEKKDKVKYF